jgi:hypothetical protein
MTQSKEKNQVEELSKNHTLNELQEYSKNVPLYLNEYTEKDFKEAHKLKKERIFKSSYFVTMNDKFMSGWGLSKGKTNKLIIACDTYEEAKTVERNASKRPEMKYINICGNKPQIKSHQYPSWKHIEDMGEIWTK